MLAPARVRSLARLRDGSTVTIRPIRADDAPRLQALFGRLSPQTILFRFLEQTKELSAAQAQQLANVDYGAQMALVAASEQDGEERIIGVARYAPAGPGEPGTAEFAIVIEDPYQGRGLGRILFQRLVAYARSQGVRTFLGLVRYENVRMMRFLEFSGLPMESIRFVGGVWEVRLKLL